MYTKTVSGYYGSNNTPCNIFVYELYNGANWYCVEGSCNVNATCDDIEEGCNIEELADDDCCTASSPIDSEDELVAFIDEE